MSSEISLGNLWSPVSFSKIIDSPSIVVVSYGPKELAAKHQQENPFHEYR